jgi:hypothetical protein
MDQRDGLLVDIQRLTEKLRYSSEDLEKAQASQEILLREKSKYQQNMEEAVAKVFVCRVDVLFNDPNQCTCMVLLIDVGWDVMCAVQALHVRGGRGESRGAEPGQQEDQELD